MGPYRSMGPYGPMGLFGPMVPYEPMGSHGPIGPCMGPGAPWAHGFHVRVLGKGNKRERLIYNYMYIYYDRAPGPLL